MSQYRRARRPLNPAAAAAANNALAAETGGRSIRPGETALREKWMDAYIAAGGKYDVVGKRRKKPKECVEPCPHAKSVTARIISVEFLSDHLDSSGKKLLKKHAVEKVKSSWKDSAGVTQSVDVDSELGDTFTEYMKPEWDVARGGSSDSHPISHTKNLPIKVKVKIEFKVTPDGESASFTELKGNCAKPFLKFTKTLSRSVQSETVEVELTSLGKLPDHVDLVEESIDWKATADGEEKSLGQTGTHKIYVTFDTPHGKLTSPRPNSFAESGTEQVVTDRRLRYSVNAAKGKGVAGEQECVDAIFVELFRQKVGYVLDHRWEPGSVNNTWVDPKPSLHHYMWMCNERFALAECHNIAASFMLACRILGVKESFSVGFMYPWPGRKETHPTYPRSTDKSSSGRNILGKLNSRYTRTHSGEGHGRENLVFVDGNGDGNNFEGVAVYKGNALYAIGDDVFDRFPAPHDNASCYYGDRTVRSGVDQTLRLSSSDFSKGIFDVRFTRCPKPYPWKTTRVFRWED